MNKNFKNHYQNIVSYDLLSKLHFKNLFELPKITKICLNIGFKNSNIEKKKLTNIIVLLKLITNQEPIPTKSKKNNIFLKIKKGSIIGCKVTLRKNNLNIFLEKLLFFILPTINNIKLHRTNKNILNFQIKYVLHFFELKTEFLKFKEIPPIDISIHSNTENNKNFFLLLNYFYIIKN
jgi:large subunit ribosomal protein L5